MRATLEGNVGRGFSDKLQISAIGHVGDFTVENPTTKRPFNFGYSVSLWGNSKSNASLILF